MKAMKFLPTCIAVTLPLFSASIYAADVEGLIFLATPAMVQHFKVAMKKL
ncbi:hypothetical protein [Vibrio navarrensis]|nr:hypothetical protein [Vibrio navarrensis]